jgi:hypothetical protein
MQHHHWKADALNSGLYTIGVRLYMKCLGTRLRKVFPGSHDGKLDHWNMGTSALVQLNFEVTEALTETEEFSAKDLKDINRRRIYLQVFFVSYISTHDGQGITDWARKGRRDGGRKSSWA